MYSKSVIYIIYYSALVEDKDMRDFVSDFNAVDGNSESNSVERNFNVLILTSIAT